MKTKNLSIKELAAVPWREHGYHSASGSQG